nr:TlpA disulfide reductase family protein [uncultured Draconibacterium sp.]
MIEIKRIIFFFLFLVILSGCHEKNEIEQGQTLTVVTGKVSNMQVYLNTKEFTVNIIDFRGKKTIYSDSIKSDGTFSIEFDLYKPQDITIDPIVGKIIAHPGDSIHLGIDFADIGNIKFSGDRARSNIDLNKFLNSYYSIINFTNEETRRMEFRTYRSFCDSVKLVADKKQQEFVKEFNPTTEVKAWTTDYMTIRYQQALLYFQMHYAYIRNIKSYTELDLPDDYYSFLENIDTDFSDSIVNASIYELLSYYTSNYAQRTILDTTQSFNESYLTLANKLLNEHNDCFFRQMVIGNLFYQQLNRNDVDFFTDNINLMDKNVHDSSLKIPLENYYADLQKQIENPEINSNATLAKLTGTAGESLIDSIWGANQGKVIYIDFWATWCGPCKAEMPNSKKLQKKLAGEDVAFVYMCIDSDEKQWKLALSQMQLEGQHYFCDRKQSGSIRNAFDIEGIPHYMLVSKHGHIVEYDSSRPMNPETIEKIEKLLHEE